MRYHVKIPFVVSQTWIVDALSSEAAREAVAEGHGVLVEAATVEPGDALSVEYWTITEAPQEEEE